MPRQVCKVLPHLAQLKLLAVNTKGDGCLVWFTATLEETFDAKIFRQEALVTAIAAERVFRSHGIDPPVEMPGILLCFRSPRSLP